MGHVGEARGRRDAVRPRLDFGSFDLDGPSAVAAHQMMVMAVGGTAAVEGLTVVAPQHVDLATVGEDLQMPVDGGQADGLAGVAQVRVQVLGAGEGVDLGERGGDGIALTGGPDGCSPAERGPSVTGRAAWAAWAAGPPGAGVGAGWLDSALDTASTLSPHGRSGS